jgi:hypothetical protein
MKYTIVTCTNSKYTKLAEFWSSYITKLGLDYQIHCSDIESYAYLSSKDIKCINSIYSYNPDKFNFIDYGLMRFNIIKDLLESYDYVIYSDIDAIWESNPLPDIPLPDYDIHLSTVNIPGVWCHGYPQGVGVKWGCTVCTGWLIFGKRSIKLLEDFISTYNTTPDLHREETGQYGNDQAKFNYFLYKINPNIIRNVPRHNFTLSLHEYNLSCLGLNEHLIHRGSGVDGVTKVIHPIKGAFIKKYGDWRAVQI